MTAPKAFCTKCGERLRPAMAYCTRCGATVGDEAPLAQAAGAEGVAIPAGGQSWAAQATTVAGQVRGAYGAAAGAAGLAMGLPWQTLYGKGEPDVRALLASAALPAAQQAVRRSLRRPGVALLVTSVLDLVVAFLTRGPGAIVPALGRLALAGATSLFSIVTGPRTGPLRLVTGVLGVITTLVQLGSAALAVYAGIRGAAPVLTLLPGVVAMLSTLAMAVKTAVVAFSRTA